MSRDPLRKDKTCLNCNYVVEQRYCPNCGQENTESRKTFHHLFIHFFEDLTHYENAFWRTIKNLLFKPAALTKEYLSGKRLSYLAPVRLYIFISFVTFFLITVIPDSEDHLLKSKQTTTTKVKDKNGVEHDSVINVSNPKLRDVFTGGNLPEDKDSTQVAKTNTYINGKKRDFSLFNPGYESVRQLDSMQRHGPPAEKLGDLEYWIVKKTIGVREHNTNAEIFDKFKESFVHNLPKVLFIYMPLFAFFLWLFHNKKRWYYFEHGIFTLHYFSFLLLTFLLLFMIDWLLSFGNGAFFETINKAIHAISLLWMFYYFFPAHHRFYGETRLISALKSIMLFWINCILILVILVLFALYTFINLH